MRGWALEFGILAVGEMSTAGVVSALVRSPERSYEKGTATAVDDSGKTSVSTSTTTQTSGIEISAPTPGNIVRLEVEVGDTISKEQTLLVMEAMKMESEVKSSHAGVVQAVYVKAGNTVQTGDALVTLRE